MSVQERLAALRAEKGTQQVERVSTSDKLAQLRAAKTSPDTLQDDDVERPSIYNNSTRKVDPDALSSNLGRAVDTLQANVGGTMQAVGQATGSEFLVDRGTQLIEEQQAEAAEYGKPTEPRSYKEVDWGNAGEIAKFGSNLMQDSAPSMGATMASAGAGAAIGSKLPIPYGTYVGGAIGGLLGGMGINIGEVQNSIHERNPDAVAPWTSIIAGTGMSFLDAGGATFMLKPLIKDLGKEVVYKALKETGTPQKIALDLIAGASTEGAIGAAQGAIGEYATQTGAEEERNWGAVQEAAVNEAISGALMGGAIKTATGAMGRIADNQVLDGEAFESKLKEADTGEQGMLAKTWSTFGGRSTDMLKGLGEASPTAKEFGHIWNPDETGKTASGKTIFEDSDLMSGKFRTSLEGATKGKNLEAEYSHAAKRGVEKNDLRKVLDGVHQEAVSRGLDLGYIEGHLPLTMDINRITENRSQFLHDITPHFESPAAAAKALADYEAMVERRSDTGAVPLVDRWFEYDETTGKLEIKDKFRKDKDDPESMRYKVAQGSVVPKFGHLEESRAFASVPQDTLNKYVVEQSADQKHQAVKDYIDGASHRLAFVDKFGVNGEKGNAMIARIVDESQAQGRPVSKIEVNRMYDLMDAYNGMLGRMGDKRLRDITSVTAAVVTMKTLPLSAMSSLTELLTPAMRGDVSSAIYSAAPAMAQVAKDVARTLMKGSERSEFSLLASEANITLDAATSVMSERIGQNMFNKSSAKAMRWFFLLNGLSYLTHFNRVYAAKTADTIFKRNLNALASGLPVNSPKGRNYTNQLRSMGVDVNTNADAVVLNAPANPSQVAARKEARVMAMKRFTDQSVLNPNVATTPMWMNDGKMQMLAMLKRYPSAFGNTILPQLARKISPDYSGSYTRSAGTMVGVGFTVGLILMVGYIQDEMKQITKSGELEYDDDRTEFQRFMDVINIALLPLQMGIFSDMFASQRYGSSPIEVLAGPVGGVGKDLSLAGIRTIKSFEDDNPTAGYIGEFLFKQTPIRPFKPAQEGIKDIFNIE